MATKGTADTSLVKGAYTKTSYDNQKIIEFKKCLDPKTGYEYFLRNFYYIQHPVTGRELFNPFPYQEELMHNYHNYRFGINMLGRQMGKTTVAAGYLLWFAMFNPDKTILVAAHKATGAQEIMRMIRHGYEHCPDHIRAGSTKYNEGTLEFDNGSRIISDTTTETTGRGKAISLIYLDEFAFVPDRIATEFWSSLAPTLSTGGKCIITSTPSSDEDTFATIWHGAVDTLDEHGNENPDGIGRNKFKAFKATWDKRTDRPPEFEAEQRAQIGDDTFEREHNCEFIIHEETLINPLVLAGMTERAEDPLFHQGAVRWYKRPTPGCMYLLSLDPSMGTGGDNAAIQVLEMPTMYQVAEWCHNKTPIEDQLRIMKEIMEFLVGSGAPYIYWSVENNTLGEAALVVIRDTGEENFPGEFLTEPKKPMAGRRMRQGFNTTARNKLEACARLKRMIEQEMFRVRSKPLISELKTFIAKGNSYAAKSGQKDDVVMSMILMVRMIDYISSFEDEVYEAVNSSIHIDEDDDYNSPMPMGMI